MLGLWLYGPSIRTLGEAASRFQALPSGLALAAILPIGAILLHQGLGELHEALRKQQACNQHQQPNDPTTPHCVETSSIQFGHCAGDLHDGNIKTVCRRCQIDCSRLTQQLQLQSTKPDTDLPTLKSPHAILPPVTMSGYSDRASGYTPSRRGSSPPRVVDEEVWAQRRRSSAEAYSPKEVSVAYRHEEYDRDRGRSVSSSRRSSSYVDGKLRCSVLPVLRYGR